MCRQEKECSNKAEISNQGLVREPNRARNLGFPASQASRSRANRPADAYRRLGDLESALKTISSKGARGQEIPFRWASRVSDVGGVFAT